MLLNKLLFRKVTMGIQTKFCMWLWWVKAEKSMEKVPVGSKNVGLFAANGMSLTCLVSQDKFIISPLSKVKTACSSKLHLRRQWLLPEGIDNNATLPLTRFSTRCLAEGDCSVLNSWIWQYSISCVLCCACKKGLTNNMNNSKYNLGIIALQKIEE